MLDRKSNFYFLPFHLAAAVFLAISVRFFGSMLFALALPLFRPPKGPNVQQQHFYYRLFYGYLRFPWLQYLLLIYHVLYRLDVLVFSHIKRYGKLLFRSDMLKLLTF
jgi:hypothetical protein